MTRANAGAWVISVLAILGPGGSHAQSAPGKGECVLAEDGRPGAVIVLAAKPTRPAQLAAAELQHYVRKITGATLAIVPEDRLTDAQAGGDLVLVGESARTRQIGLRNADLARQEHVIRTQGRALVLMGRDEEEYGPVHYRKTEPWRGCRLDWPWYVQLKALGSMYAVDTFLERVCRVRWYLPGEIGEVCPKQRTLRAKNLDLRLKPWTKYRMHTRPSMLDPFDFYIAGRNHKKMIPRRDALLWWLRMKIGGDPFQVNHSVYSYYARFAKTHPEWFANGKPQPRTHMCYLHPGFIAQHAQDARDYFDGKLPDLKFPTGGRVMAAGDYYACVPIDSSTGWCQCARCKPLLDMSQPGPKGVPGASFFNGRYSEYVWTFVNSVAREVRKTHPDKWISAIAYARYFLPPKTVKLEPNIAVCVTTHMLLYGDPKAKQYFNDTLRAWRSRVKELYIWEYYLNQYFGKYCVFPWITPHIIGEEIEFLRRLGIKGMFVELSGWKGRWANPAEDLLPVYVTFKMLADDSLTVEGILEEHYRLFYGPAAEPMRAFFEKIEAAWRNPKTWAQSAGRQRRSWEILCPPAELAEYHKLINQAAAFATEEPYRTRVRLMREAVYKPMEKHCLEYVERRKMRRRLECPLVREAPTIDGKLDDPAWRTAARTGAFVGLTMGKVEVDTIGYVTRDETMLYVAFDCPEPNMDKLVVEHTVPDSTAVCLDDDVEIFIDVGRTRRAYYHFLINAAGVFCDRGVGKGYDGGGEGWNSGAKIATQQGPKGWTVEAAIPLASMNAQARPGEVWGFNLCRTRRAGFPGHEPQTTCWSPTFGGFNTPDEFGALVMSARPSAAQPLRLEPVVAFDFEDAPTRSGLRIASSAAVQIGADRVAASAVLTSARGGKPWSPAHRVEGKHGKAYAFEKADKRYIKVTLPGALGLARDDWTVTFWLKTAEQGPSTILFSSTTPPYWGIALQRVRGKHLLRFLFATEPPSVGANASADRLADGRWHHVAIAVDRARAAVIYIDGQRAGAAAISRHTGAIKNAFTIGGPYNYFHGAIDCLRMYKGALGRDRIAKLFAQEAAHRP